jgi:hypothetical protein
MKLAARKAAAALLIAGNEARPNRGPDYERRPRHCDLVHNFDHILMISNGRVQQSRTRPEWLHGHGSAIPQRAAAADKGREE